MVSQQIILTFGIGGALFLLGASAFFSASETALVSLSAQKSKRLALKNPAMKNALLGWIRQPHELLTLILVGNTFATIMFAAAVTAIFVSLLPAFNPSLVEILTWALETIAIVMVGDMAPKFYARTYPEKTSLMVLPILSWLRRLLTPVARLFSFLRVFFPKGSPQPIGDVLTFSMQELKSLLEEGHEATELPPDSMSMMQRVLDINARQAQTIMTPIEKVDLIELDPKGKPMRERELLLDLIVEEGHTRTPLKWKGEIIGFIHADDLLPYVLNDTKEELTRMVRKAIDVPQGRLVNQLLQDFRESGIYLGFVRDENKKIIGLVTLEDVLEEITGEILDEYDVAFQKEPR